MVVLRTQPGKTAQVEAQSGIFLDRAGALQPQQKLTASAEVNGRKHLLPTAEALETLRSQSAH